MLVCNVGNASEERGLLMNSASCYWFCAPTIHFVKTIVSLSVTCSPISGSPLVQDNRMILLCPSNEFQPPGIWWGMRVLMLPKSMRPSKTCNHTREVTFSSPPVFLLHYTMYTKLLIYIYLKTHSCRTHIRHVWATYKTDNKQPYFVLRSACLRVNDNVHDWLVLNGEKIPSKQPHKFAKKNSKRYTLRHSPFIHRLNIFND